METPDSRIPVLLAQCHKLLARIGRRWRERLWPLIRRGLGLSYDVTRHRILPAVGDGTRRLKGEMANIHRQQNWLERCSTTFAGNAAGLGVAMLSTRLVESMVEKRQLSNMWGIFAKHPVVSETTFEVLSFVVEFLLGLIVFTITEYYVGEYQRRRKSLQLTEAISEEDEG